MSVFGVILVRIFPHSDWIRRDTQSASGKIQTRITPNTDTFYTVKFIRKDEKVYILSLFFLCFCTWTYRKKRGPYILQVFSFAIAFLENFWMVLHFSNFLREVSKVTKYLKTSKIKIFILSFWMKKSYRNIIEVTTLTSHNCFHADRSNSINNGNIITNDENPLVHLRCYCCAKISSWQLLKL